MNDNFFCFSFFQSSLPWCFEIRFFEGCECHNSSGNDSMIFKSWLEREWFSSSILFESSTLMESKSSSFFVYCTVNDHGVAFIPLKRSYYHFNFICISHPNSQHLKRHHEWRSLYRFQCLGWTLHSGHFAGIHDRSGWRSRWWRRIRSDLYIDHITEYQKSCSTLTSHYSRRLIYQSLE